MSLARTLMSGSVSGLSNPNKYGHENGASTIAIESVEELHEIFLESYNYEQAELAAATEGIALEGSQYEAVAEASIKNAINKIKEFFLKLWNKVKAFFHNIKRYIDSLFMSGKEFVSKYKDDISKIDNIKDLTVTMYKYDDAKINTCDIEKMTTKFKAGELADDITVNGSNMLTDTYSAVANAVSKLSGGKAEAAAKVALDAIAANEEEINKLSDQFDDIDETELSKQFFAYYRNGAEDAEDKVEVDITTADIRKMVDALGKTDSSKFASLESKINKAYNDKVNAIGKLADGLDKIEGDNATVAAKAAAVARKTSNIMSKSQNYMNKKINAWKSVVSERDGVYKRVIMAAISNSNKNNKKSYSTNN